MGTLEEIVAVARARKSAAVMGVLNTTPDSFFDGGAYTTASAIEARINDMLRDGADILDIGAESTRPQARPVLPEEQWERSQFALRFAVERGACVSVDTTSPYVAERAIRLGAHAINDVSCMADPDLARVVSKTAAHLIIMHSRGNMTSMSGYSDYDEAAYDDVVTDVITEWSAAKDRARRLGVSEERIWFDPGFGFHKNAQHSGSLLRGLSRLKSISSRLVVGTSRKSFIGALDGSPPPRRLGGSLASALLAVQSGAVVLRVHDIHDTHQALLALTAWSPTSPLNQASEADEAGATASNVASLAPGSSTHA